MSEKKKHTVVVRFMTVSEQFVDREHDPTTAPKRSENEPHFFCWSLIVCARYIRVKRLITHQWTIELALATIDGFRKRAPKHKN